MKFQYLLLIISPIILIIINTSSFDTIVYVYFLITFLLILSIITKHNLKAWYWLSLFLVLYALPHFILFYLFGKNSTVIDINYNKILNDFDNNLKAIRLLSSFVIFLFIGSSFYNLVIGSNLIRINSNFYLNNANNIKMNNRFILNLILFSLIIFSFLSVDFTSLKNEYKLIGFNIVFSLCYFINFIILIVFFNQKINNKLLFFGIFLYLIILSILGVRQIIFWLFLSLLIAHFFKCYLLKKEINWKLIFIYSFSLLLIFGIVLGYRANKQIDSEIFNRIIELSYSGIVAETTYTFYNLLAVYDLTSENVGDNRDLFFMKNFIDAIFYLIPSFIFPNKYEYIELLKIAKEFNLKPFGTYFYLGEIKLGLRYNILIYFYAIILGFFTEYFLNYVIKKKDKLLYVLYIAFLVMVIIYPVRGTIPGGIKIFITFNLLVYFIIKYKFRFK